MFRIVESLPKARGQTEMTGAALVDAAKGAKGKWVEGREYPRPKTASNRAAALRKRFPGFEFAARAGVIYCRKAAKK